MDNSIQYLIDRKFKERKKKNDSKSTEDDQLPNANTQPDIAVTVMDDTAKKETSTSKESQSHADHEVAATPVRSSIKTENITKMENIEKFQSEKEPKCSISTNVVLEVNNGSEKEEAKIVKQSNVDEAVAETTVRSSIKTENITKMENIEKFQSEKEPKCSISTNVVLEVNNGPQKEEAKIVKQTNVDEAVAATPVRSSIKTENITKMENIEKFQSEKEPKCSISTNVVLEVNNGSEKEEAKIVKQSNVDEAVSARPGPSWLNTSNPVEMANLLKNIKDFKPRKQMEDNHESINNNGQSNSDIHVNQRPKNEEDDTLTQSSSGANQGVSATFQRTTTSSTNTSGINDSSEQTQPGYLTDRTRRTVYVGNLQFSVHAVDLYHYFSLCGTIFDVKVLSDKITKHSRGYAFIEFTDVKSVELALKMNGFFIRGRKILVQQKKTNEPVNHAKVNSQRPDITSNVPLPMVPRPVPMSVASSEPNPRPMPMPMSVPAPVPNPRPMSMSMISAPMVPAPITPFNHVQQNVPQQMGPVFTPNGYYQNPTYHPLFVSPNTSIHSNHTVVNMFCNNNHS